MVGLLHAFAELHDRPEREKSDDSDREVEQVKHGHSPCNVEGSEPDEHRMHTG
jgi:hypothetical protein